METKHTPGPWKAVKLDEYTVVIKTDRNHTHECIHIADAHIMSGNLANAKLIAAAPELLDALQMAQRLLKLKIGDLYNKWPEYNVIESAIKKATE